MAVEKKTMFSLRASFFTLSLALSVFAPRIPQLKDRLHISVPTLGLVFMITGLAGAVTSKLVAKIIARLTSRRSLIFAIPVMMSGSLLIALSHRIPFFVCGLVLLSFGGFLINTAVNTQSNNLRATTGNNQLNNLSAISNLGSLFAMIMGSLLLKAFTATQYIIGLQVIACSIFLYSYRNLIPTDVIGGQGEKAKSKFPWFKRDPDIIQFWIIVVALFASTTAEFSVSDWGAVLSRDSYAVKAPFYLVPFIVFQSGIVLSRFMTTRFSDRHGEVAFVRYSAIGAALIWGASIQIAAHMNHSNQALTLTVLIIGFFAAGCGVGPVWPTMLTSASKSHYPTPVVLARLFSFVSLAFVFGPGIIGFVSKITSLSNALMIPVTSLVIVGIFARRSLEHHE